MSSRRDFIKGAAFTAGGYALNPVDLIIADTLNTTSIKSKVAISKGNNRRELTQKVLDPFRDIIKAGSLGKQIYIKVNLVEYNYPLAVTHVDTVRGLLDFLSPLTDQQIIIGESTSIFDHTTTECFEVHGYLPLEKEYNVQLLDIALGPYTQVNWIKDSYKHILKPYITSHVIDSSKYHISLARMKTHGLAVCTLAFKNYMMGSTLNFPSTHPLYSGTTNSRTLMHLGGSNKGLCQNLVLMSKHILPDFSIIDGFEGMEGEGPSRGTPVDHRIMVAGTDLVSVDRVGLELMGLDYNVVKHIQWASDLGIGQGNLDNIEIIGEDLDENRKYYQKSPYYLQSIAYIDIAPIPDWTGVEDVVPEPVNIANFPNPFNASTSVEITIPYSGFAEVYIYNIAGQKVRRLIASHMGAGKHIFVWDARDDHGRNVSSGTYFIRLNALSRTMVQKTMLLR